MTDFAAGERVVVRDEEWLVRSVRQTAGDGARLDVTGVSELVRDQRAVFYTGIDTDVERLDPRDATLVFDETPSFRRSRLWLESVLRRSPVPVSDTRITVGNRGLLDHMDYQLRPAERALNNLRPRVLIGDAVGLGKTLEIGMLLSELIRRGRGERILVVTPRAVLEQFQHELWTRFAIPLVRLDSTGIAKVRQTLPSSRNPFSYYKRVIVSIDTLKNPAHYRHHLRNQRWDAVVIDECHNLINRGTQNNALARLLAEQTDALILSSATPHNGKPESFAELVGLLDPTAIADRESYSGKDIEHLYVRRHRNSKDVQLEVAHNWKERATPEIVPVVPTAAESAVLVELNHTWLHPDGESVVLGKGQQLFPWTLFKAFLSSPRALTATIGRRLQTIGPTASPERAALVHLDDLAKAADAVTPAKLTALTAHLQDLGVSRTGTTRVVVFSERIDTLRWLRSELTSRLGLPADSVEVLHAQLPDEKVQAVVEGFSQTSSPIRVLLASDMASEGLNLHKECHLLVHYDLPWSFIRIQQRNGRIDRYGQLVQPQITALALTNDDPQISSDLRVVTKLLQKEDAANRALGDAGVLLDVHDADIEEDTVMRAMREGRDLDAITPEPVAAALNPFAALMATGGEHESDASPEVAPAPTLFADDDNFLTEVLRDIAEEVGPNVLDVSREDETGLIAFTPPPDLVPRFRDLPLDYLSERKIAERIKLSAHPAFAERRLEKVRKESDSTWPDVHFLAPLHPVLDWAADRAMSRFGRNQVPVMVGAVQGPTFLTQAVWSNSLGQPAIGHWGAVTGLPHAPAVGELLAAIDAAGIREKAVNPGGGGADLGALQRLVPAAIACATEHLRARREEIESGLLRRIENYRDQLAGWQQQSLFRIDERSAPDARKRRSQVDQLVDETSRLIDSLAASGEPYVRVVGVVVPRTM